MFVSAEAEVSRGEAALFAPAGAQVERKDTEPELTDGRSPRTGPGLKKIINDIYNQNRNHTNKLKNEYTF